MVEASFQGIVFLPVIDIYAQESVYHVSEQVLPMSPACTTMREGWLAIGVPG